MKTKERNVFIDLLKILAIFMVIVSHSLTLQGPSILASIAVPMFLVITGYNYTYSFENKNLSFKEYYSHKNFCKKLKRILIPYSVMVALHIILFFSLNIVDDITSFFVSFLIGGMGDGGYYTFLILQIILLFPIIQLCVKKWRWKALTVTALIQFVFEIFVNLILPNSFFVDQIYRFLILRQILYVTFGCFVYYNKNNITDLISSAFILIGLLMFVLYAKGLYIPIIFTKWTPTTMLFSMLPMGIVYFATKSRQIKINKFPIITLISNATFHIFLIQQTYFYIIRKIPFAYSGVWVNAAICFAVGVIFYLTEIFIEKLIKQNKTHD